jgi:hypothetical protein
MQNDEWIRRLVADEPRPKAPRAAVADRVLLAIRAVSANASDQRLPALVVVIVASAALWLVWLAIPAWDHLNSPVTILQDRLHDQFTRLR